MSRTKKLHIQESNYKLEQRFLSENTNKKSVNFNGRTITLDTITHYLDIPDKTKQNKKVIVGDKDKPIWSLVDIGIDGGLLKLCGKMCSTLSKEDSNKILTFVDSTETSMTIKGNFLKPDIIIKKIK